MKYFDVQVYVDGNYVRTRRVEAEDTWAAEEKVLFETILEFEVDEVE